jgi:uncharacterized protein (UPF0332 family)
MEKLAFLYLEKAENELVLAESLFKISSESSLKERLNIRTKDTFYSAVISHAYYCVFYSARAYLISKGIKIPEQGQHQAVYFGFKRMVQQGLVQKELLEIYENVKIKAEVLLGIFQSEREKRTQFVYKTTAQANIQPARGSLENAGTFFKHLNDIIEKLNNGERNE